MIHVSRTAQPRERCAAETEHSLILHRTYLSMTRHLRCSRWAVPGCAGAMASISGNTLKRSAFVVRWKGSEVQTIGLTGDVMLGRGVDYVIDRKDTSWIWGNVLPTLRSLDLLAINLECTLTLEVTEALNGSYKPFHFRSDPSHVAELVAANVGFASLANNHIGDFGHIGLTDTIDTLRRSGIAFGGAGRDSAEAFAPTVVPVGSINVAFVSFADYPIEWAATANTPGLNYTRISTEPSVFSRVRVAIERAAAIGDIVVFSIHWGPNMRQRPTPEFRQFARSVIDAGADVFWGHSAHLVQGIEVHRGYPILYDTGDFLDDYAVDPVARNDLSALFMLRIIDGRVQRIDLLPVVIGECRVNLANGSSLSEFTLCSTTACEEMGTQVNKEGDLLVVGLPPLASRTPE